MIIDVQYNDDDVFDDDDSDVDVVGPRQSVCSTDGDGGSTRTKSRVSQRSSVTLPALENSTEPEMEAEEAPEKVCITKMIYHSYIVQ